VGAPRRALVTGAGGFIGSHLVEALVDRGHRVTALVHYNGRSDPGLLSELDREHLSGVEVVSGDIRDPFLVRRAVRGCDCVFHLAALIGVPYSYVAPTEYVTVNVLGTAHLLQACLDEGVGRVVHVSTSEVYGSARRLPVDEEHPLQGQSPYAASKIGGEKLAEAFHRSFGCPVVVVRPFNTYGPRQSARAIIPTVIAQALAGGPIRLGALEPTRDFTFVSDTVAGLIAVGGAEGVAGTTVNLGSGRGTTVAEIVALVSQAVGAGELQVTPDATRLRPAASEVTRLLADSSRARRLCGWRPATSLEDGLAATIDWVRSHPERFKASVYAI
jgi:NAD dependent epimerase/dehydratase